MYHGWQYNTDGKVIKLPSCLPDKSIPTCAKVRKYPTKVVEGWLWVHPGTPEQVQSAPEPVFCKPWGDETPNPTLIEYIDIEVDHCLLTGFNI